MLLLMWSQARKAGSLWEGIEEEEVRSTSDLQQQYVFNREKISLYLNPSRCVSGRSLVYIAGSAVR